MGVGLFLFWPALFLLSESDHREELGRLRGEYEALQQAAIEKQCPDILWTGQDQQAFAGPGSGEVPQDPAETSGAGTFSRNCLDPGYSELAECRDYLLAWDAAQARNQINPTAGTSNAARAAVAPTARTGSAGPRVADPALTRGAGSTSRNCLDPGFDQLEECKDYVATWEEDQARGQTSSATGKGPAAGATAAPRRSVSGAITSAVDPVEITGGQRNCTDPAFADLLECRKWLEAWNTAQAEGRPLPPPTAPLSGAAIAAAPVAGAKPARAVEMAAYGVSLARYSERNLAIRSWDQFVERFPLLGAATSRVAATTAADGKAAYILQGMGLTERQAQSICGNMRRAYEFCEVVRL
jgi:hypothetical protein